MNARRAFLRMAPLAAGVAAFPVIATAAHVIRAPGAEVPMCGKTPEGYNWTMIALSTCGPLPPSSFESAAMVPVGDGRYQLLYTRTA